MYLNSEYKTKEKFLNEGTNFVLTKIGFHRPFGFEMLSQFDFDKHSKLLNDNDANTIDAIRKITNTSRISLLEDYLIDKGFIIPHYENEQFNGTPSLFRLTPDGKELLRIGSIEKYNEIKEKTILKLKYDTRNARILNFTYIIMAVIASISLIYTGCSYYKNSHITSELLKIQEEQKILTKQIQLLLQEQKKNDSLNKNQYNKQ
jgi:hypothetical protein